MSCEGEGRRHRSRIGPRDPQWRRSQHHGLKARHEREIEQCERVSVTPFREKFVRLRETRQMSTSQLCMHMGWVYRPSADVCRREGRRPGYVKPSINTALVTLGMGRHHKQNHDLQATVTYDVALRLANALGMDPYEAGI